MVENLSPERIQAHEDGPSQIEGIVLRVFPSREADMVLRILTITHGKISALAKHARGSKKRFGGGVDVFDRGTFELKAGKGSLPLVRGFHSAAVYGTIRTDLNKIALASCICEAADHLMLEGAHSNEQEYKVVVDTLQRIDATSNLADLLSISYQALAALLEEAGYMDERFSGRGSAHQLMLLVRHLEKCTDKKSATLDSVIAVIDDFKRSMATAA